MITAELREWSSWPPEDGPPVPPHHLEPSAEVRALADTLHRSGRLRVRELRSGLRLEATSYVGTVRLGALAVVIRPKLPGLPLRTLLRYAYGLCPLERFDALPQDTAPQAFQALLLHQLEAELQRLLGQGPPRGYVQRAETLDSPRGRIDLSASLQALHAGQARLRCTHHARLEDHPLNQTLRAGLALAARLTHEPALRQRLHRLDTGLRGVTPVRLEPWRLTRALHDTNRLTAAYRPALTLLRLLLDAGGMLPEDAAHTHVLPGFLFDMNRFFQALLGRFLTEHLPGLTVHPEFPLQGMMAYAPAHNPLGRRAPVPRPDFALRQGPRVLALLEAKYRDLWETPLPRDMLYQLSLYALSHDALGSATLLYATLAPDAREQVIDVRDVVHGARRGRVVLRPVVLPTLAHLLEDGGKDGLRNERLAFARWLALGERKPA
ncbi:McrC family protein [Melittangium boletus]|uniref:McrC family protein n=1 Tax=Melittangium boletus TaxID=83453 RepID=UPI003DA1D438